MITSNWTQYGVIVYGNGINTRVWIDNYKAQGYAVMLRDGYCEIYKRAK